jgi:hypothetical protein
MFTPTVVYGFRNGVPTIVYENQLWVKSGTPVDLVGVRHDAGRCSLLKLFMNTSYGFRIVYFMEWGGI